MKIKFLQSISYKLTILDTYNFYPNLCLLVIASLLLDMLILDFKNKL